MKTPAIETHESSDVSARAEVVFTALTREGFRRTDRLFIGLLALEWLTAIVVALLISPLTWIGEESRTHIHVWAASLLGGAIVALPVALGLSRPGSSVTRHIIAAGQMLMGALLIRLFRE